jgi:hypothetical protein
VTLRLWEFVSALALLALATIFAAAGRWLEASVLILASVFGTLVRASLVERGIAGGYATSRAHLLAAQTAVLFLSYGLVVGLLMVAAVGGWTSDTRGAVATYALIALAVVLYRDMDSRLRRALDYLVGGAAEARVGAQLDELKNEGWWVGHDIPRDRGGNIDHLAWRDSAAYAIETKSGRFHRRQIGRIKADAAWAKWKYGLRWVEPVICVCSEPPAAPQYEQGVWILGPDQLVDWLRSGQGTRQAARVRL